MTDTGVKSASLPERLQCADDFGPLTVVVHKFGILVGIGQHPAVRRDHSDPGRGGGALFAAELPQRLQVFPADQLRAFPREQTRPGTQFQLRAFNIGLFQRLRLLPEKADQPQRDQNQNRRP